MTAVGETSDWTITRLLTWTTDYLARSGIADARLSAEVLLAHAAGCRRIELYTHFERVLDGDRLARFRDVVRRAADHEPIAYLVGHKEFYSLDIAVTPAVLIPRPETETLVAAVIDECDGRAGDVVHVLDVGTGSGCMAVAVLSRVPRARVVATDIAPAALDVARGNAERHGVADRLTLAHAGGPPPPGGSVPPDRVARLDGAPPPNASVGDGPFAPPDVVPDGGFAVVMSNPPYVPLADVAGLDETVRAYEPHAALTDGGDGLGMFRMLADRAGAVLSAGGAVFVEVGDGQAAAVVRVFDAAGGWTHRRTLRDTVVGQERVIAFARA
ncbi:MAG: N5-glutamine methyltransferase family protein [Phycisphaerae bacterium]